MTPRALLMSALVGAGCFNPGSGGTTGEVTTTSAGSTTSGVPTTSTSGVESTGTSTEAVVTTGGTSDGTCADGCMTAPSGTTEVETTGTTTRGEGLDFVQVVVDYPGAYGLAVGDLNGDEQVGDIVISSRMATDFGYLVGGDMTLKLQASGLSSAVAILDRAAPAGDDVVSALFGSPAAVGFYKNAVPFMASTDSLPMTCFEPLSVAVGELNGDAFDDVVVACNEYTEGVYVLYGVVDGFDSVVATLDLDIAPTRIALVDVIGPSEGVDLVAVSATTGDVRVYAGDQVGAFETMWKVSHQVDNATGLAVGEVNDDDLPDVGITATGGSCWVFVGNPESGISAEAELVCGAGPVDIAFGAIDGDGIDDAVTVHADEVHISLAAGGGAFLAPLALQGPAMPYRVAVTDFNGDGLGDIVVTAEDLAAPLSLFLQQ